MSLSFKSITDVLTTFQVILRDKLDAERLPVGLTLVETNGNQITVSTSDPNAAAKLAAHPAILGVKRMGRAVLLADFVDVDD